MERPVCLCLFVLSLTHMPSSLGPVLTRSLRYVCTVGTWVYVSEGKGNVDQVGLQHIFISVSQHEEEDDDDDDGARLSLSLSHTHTHTIGASHNSELRLNLLRLEGLTVSSLLWRLTYCSVEETERERDFTYIRLHPSTADHLIILLSISF